MLDQILYGLNVFLGVFCFFCGVVLWKKRTKGDFSQTYLCCLLGYACVSFLGAFFWLRSENPDASILSMRVSVGGSVFAMCTSFYPVEAVFPKYMRGKRLLYLLAPCLIVVLTSIVIRVRGVEQHIFESPADILSYADSPQLWMRLLFSVLPFYYSIFIIFLPFGVRKTVIMPRWVYVYIYASMGVFLLYMGIILTGEHLFYLLYTLYMIIAISVLVYFILSQKAGIEGDDAGLFTPLMKDGTV